MWVTSLHQLAGHLLIFFHSHFFSNVANFDGGYHTFMKFLWRQRPIKSIYGKIYLLYSLFLFGNSVFPVVASVLTDDGSLLSGWNVRIIAQWLAKPKRGGNLVARLFELIKEWRGGRWILVMRMRTREIDQAEIGFVWVLADVALTFVLLLTIHLINDNKRNHFII